MSLLLAIDPGTTESAWVIVDDKSMRPVLHGKVKNERLLYGCRTTNADRACIEMVASYGMPVGREIFETCVWIGRFEQVLKDRGMQVDRVYRKDEKLTICNNPRANDATIRQALIDRFAYGVPNKGKGTKSKKGWFYGFKADVWQAYAVAVTNIEMKKGEKYGIEH